MSSDTMASRSNGAEDFQVGVETLGVGVAKRRSFLKGGLLGVAASFFSLGPLGGKSWGSFGDRPEILEERAVPIPESLRPSIDAFRQEYARRGFAVPLGQAKFKRATIPGGTVSWIEYTGVSIGAGSTRAFIHAGQHPKFGVFAMGSIGKTKGNRLVRLETFRYTGGSVKRQTVTTLTDGAATTRALPGVVVDDVHVRGCTSGVDFVNGLLTKAETAPLEAFDCCGCLSAIDDWYEYVCNLVSILICGYIAWLCWWCGVICVGYTYTACYWQTIPCDTYCLGCGCGLTQCDECCAGRATK